VEHVDVSLYVMTPEFGAASQLEKIDMLDFADFVAINKFDRKGAEDALRDVRKQLPAQPRALRQRPDEMPVFGTQASRFNDDGVTALYQAILDRLKEKGLTAESGALPKVAVKASSHHHAIVPRSARATSPRSRIRCAAITRTRPGRRAPRGKRRRCRVSRELFERAGKAVVDFDEVAAAKSAELTEESRKLLAAWPKTMAAYSGEEHITRVRDKEIRTKLTHETLSGSRIRKVSLPRFEDDGETLRFLRRENLPGYFPFTAGVFPFKRETEDPTRMFAGEGDAFRTNRRFKRVSEGMPAHRLSTAFDSVTLYGFDPDRRPDIYGKVGNSGVSIATLDDMRCSTTASTCARRPPPCR
jgi:methylmalonyl-CoA mutase